MMAGTTGAATSTATAASSIAFDAAAHAEAAAAATVAAAVAAAAEPVVLPHRTYVKLFGLLGAAQHNAKVHRKYMVSV